VSDTTSLAQWISRLVSSRAASDSHSVDTARRVPCAGCLADHRPVASSASRSRPRAHAAASPLTLQYRKFSIPAIKRGIGDAVPAKNRLRRHPGFVFFEDCDVCASVERLRWTSRPPYGRFFWEILHSICLPFRGEDQDLERKLWQFQGYNHHKWIHASLHSITPNGKTAIRIFSIQKTR